MLILTSNGLSTDNLLTKTKKYINGAKDAVIITTASVEYKERDKHIPRLVNELEQLGLNVDFFDFDTDKAEKLLEYDVVEINGGNPFYLLNAMRESFNCKTILQKIAVEKIVIGVSAGAIVLQSNINLIAQYSPEMNKDIKLSNFTGLGLTDIEILPHYSRFIDRFERFEERAKNYEDDNKVSVLRIDDGGAVLYENGDIVLIIENTTL